MIGLNSNATLSTDASTVTGDANTKVKVTTTDDNKTIFDLVDGKATVKGKVKTNLNGDYTFEGTDDKTYIIDKSSNKLTITEGTTVKDNKGFIYKGAGSFSFESDNKITVENGASVTSKEGGNGTSVTGIGDASNPTTIKVDEGNLSLVGGKTNVIGLSSIDVEYTADGTSKTVKVTASIGNKVIVDATNKLVTDLSKDETVRVGDVVYTAVDGSSFSLDDKKLTNDGEKATVLGDTSEDLTIGLYTLNIAIPSSNIGDVSITRNSPLSIIKLNKKGDKFTIANVTYTSVSDDTSYTIDENGNVKLVDTSASLEKKNETSVEISSKAITCEEEMKSNDWTWSERKQACVYKVSKTKTK